MIVTSGYKVAAPEVEAALLEHDSVSECAVVGVPDELRGEIVCAYVVVATEFEARRGLEGELQEFVKARLAVVQVSVADYVRWSASAVPGWGGATPCAATTISGPAFGEQRRPWRWNSRLSIQTSLRIDGYHLSGCIETRRQHAVGTNTRMFVEQITLNFRPYAHNRPGQVTTYTALKSV